MISDQLFQEINEQMNFEFFSSHVYLAMAAYCAADNLDGFANFYIAQAEEERYHAMKIYQFINMLGKRATFTGMDAPNNDYTSVLDTFEQGLKHEKLNTKRFYHLSDLALNEREHATINFLKWFVEEQVEEEDLFDGIIQRLKRIDQDSNAFFMLDDELGKRTFTAPQPL